MIHRGRVGTVPALVARLLADAALGVRIQLFFGQAYILCEVSAQIAHAPFGSLSSGMRLGHSRLRWPRSPQMKQKNVRIQLRRGREAVLPRVRAVRLEVALLAADGARQASVDAVGGLLRRLGFRLGGGGILRIALRLRGGVHLGRGAEIVAAVERDGIVILRGVAHRGVVRGRRGRGLGRGLGLGRGRRIVLPARGIVERLLVPLHERRLEAGGVEPALLEGLAQLRHGHGGRGGHRGEPLVVTTGAGGSAGMTGRPIRGARIQNTKRSKHWFPQE